LGGFCFDNLVCIDLALRKKLESHSYAFVVGHTVLYTQQKFDILSITTNTILQTKAKMKHLIRGLAIASVFALSSAAAVDVDVNEDDSSNLQRHKRNLIANSKKKNRISLNKRIRYNKKKKNDYNNVEDDDNTLFLTRLLQGSIPFTSAPTPLPVTPAPVPVPTDRPTTTSPTPIPVA